MSEKLYPQGSARLYVPLPVDVYALLCEIAKKMNIQPGRFIAAFTIDQAPAFRQLLEVMKAGKASADPSSLLEPLRKMLEEKASEASTMARNLGAPRLMTDPAEQARADKARGLHGARAAGFKVLDVKPDPHAGREAYVKALVQAAGAGIRKADRRAAKGAK